MDGNEIMTGAGGAETDGFLDGWDDREAEAPEEGAEQESGDGGDQAVPGAEVPEGAGEAGGDQAVQDAPEETGENGPQGAAGPTEAGRSGGAEDAGGGDQAPGGQQAPRTWALEHLGQTVTANEADMVTLAQKGLDYDRIRVGYDEARPVMDLFRDYAKRAGVTVLEYLARIREQAKQAEGMSREEARRAVELEDREAAVAQQEAVRRQMEEARRQEIARRQAVDARMRADLREFREAFPEAAADPASIPPEVWAAVRDGRTLVGAYAAYSHRAAQETAARKEALRAQQERNEAASTGSMRSRDGGKGPRDPFLEGWDEE